MQVWVRCGVLAAATVVASAHWVRPTEATPAYYLGVPSLRTSHPILSGAQLTGPYFAHSYQVVAYEMAAKIPKVLFQQPCYCRCDLALGHRSLHSCFEGTHGAVCATCMRQAVYAYEQTQLGKTPDEIRAGIMSGEWKNVDVENAKL